MSIEQYRTGLVRVVTGSKLVYGTGTGWSNGTIGESHKFKLDLDGGNTYTVATILSATRLQLSSSYLTASLQNQYYMVTRSFTPYRNYARLFQGDSDAADLIRDQIVTPIDTDIGKVYNGFASLDGVLIEDYASGNYWRIAVTATGELTFYCNGVKKAYVATLTGSWVPVG